MPMQWLVTYSLMALSVLRVAVWIDAGRWASGF